jgi:hypothetical protein
MQSDGSERRQAKRYQMDVPMRLGEDEGRTKDFSSRGVYFLASSPPEEGKPIEMDVTLTNAFARGPVTLHMRGRIIRVDQLESAVGVAAVIEEWNVADSEDAEDPGSSTP